MTSATHENLPWVEKYRPENLGEIYGQQETVQTIKKFAEDGRIPHLLFYGPPGSGKTSTIIALAREIYGKNYRNMVLELNASDDRGIDVVRDRSMSNRLPADAIVSSATRATFLLSTIGKVSVIGDWN